VQRKITITIDEKVYEGLYTVIGPRRISKFVEDLVRPHVLRQNLEAAYAQMAHEEEREQEALEWSELTIGDGGYEQR
jgi:predicted CopG family antitoxin